MLFARAMSAIRVGTSSHGAVVALLAKHLDVAPSRVVPLARLRDDLGASPLGLVQVALALEDRFEIEIAENDVEAFTTVGDVMRYVARVVQRRAVRCDGG